MEFSIVISLSICLFLLHERVVSSLEGPLYNRALFYAKDDSVLEEFFITFKTAYLEERVPRHISIIGASSNDLTQLQPLLNTYPCVICTSPKLCDNRVKLSRGSFVIVFLKDLSEAKFKDKLNILSLCRKCKVLFIFAGTGQMNEISRIFTLTVERNVPFAEFAQVGEHVVGLFSSFVSTNCTIEVRLTTVWKPGTRLSKINTWAFELRDLGGCPVTVSTTNFRAKMLTRENENGTLSIVGGREGRLVLALAEKLNFTVAARYPSELDQSKYSRKMAIVNDVASGNVEIGIGRLRPTNNLPESVLNSVPYDDECVTWGVPRVILWTTGVMWVEFSWQIWALIGLVWIGSVAISYFNRNISMLITGKRRNVGFTDICMGVVAIHLGNPLAHLPFSFGGKFLVMIYLHYALVMTTAYKSSLSSILATDEGTPKFADAAAIIEGNLTIEGSSYDYNILRDQINDSQLIPTLLKRFVINNNESEALVKQLQPEHDYAYLVRLSAMNYLKQEAAKAHKPITFDAVNPCVLYYHTVMVFGKKSYLRKPADILIRRLSESGILDYWDFNYLSIDKLLKHRSAQDYLNKREIYQFQYIFIVHAACLAVCCVVLLIEIIVSRFFPRKRQQAVRLYLR